MKTLLAARIEAWQEFRLRKYAEEVKIPLSIILTDAIQIYFSTLNLPQETTDRWIAEYRSNGGE